MKKGFLLNLIKPKKWDAILERRTLALTLLLFGNEL